MRNPSTGDASAQACPNHFVRTYLTREWDDRVWRFDGASERFMGQNLGDTKRVTLHFVADGEPPVCGPFWTRCQPGTTPTIADTANLSLDELIKLATPLLDELEAAVEADVMQQENEALESW